MPDPIAKRAEVLVRLILAKLNSMRMNVLVDLLSPNREQRADDGEFLPADSMRRRFAER